MKNLTIAVLGVFIKVLLMANELDLLGNTTFALDGCKISANASKERIFSDLEKKAKKIEDKIKVELLPIEKRLYLSSGASRSVGKKWP